MSSAGNRRADGGVRAIRVFLLICVVIIAVMIFVFSSQDGPNSSAVSKGVTTFIVRIVHPDFDRWDAADQNALLNRVGGYVRKCAHFLEYAALGFFLHLLLRSFSLHLAGGWAWLGSTVYAITDEIHQLFTAGRAGMWQDVALDSGGAIFGCLAAWLLAVILRALSRGRKS